MAVTQDINRSNTNQQLAGWALPVDNRIATTQVQAQPLYPTQQVIGNMNNYAEQYADTPVLANQFRVLGNELTEKDKIRNQIADFYGMFEQNINPEWDRYMQANQNLGQDIIGQLNQNKQIFETQYGPNGAQSNRLNQYYDDLGNYLVANSADAQARAEADAIASGASIGSRRAAQNAVEREQFDAMMAAQQQEIKDYESMYKTVNDYLNQFVKVYGETNDKYLIDTYKQLLDFKNQLGTALVNANVTLATQDVGAGGGSSSTSSGSGGGSGATGSSGTGGTAKSGAGFTGGSGSIATPEQIAAADSETKRRVEEQKAQQAQTTYISTVDPNTGQKVLEPVNGGVTGYMKPGLSNTTMVEGAARSIDNAIALRQDVPTIVPTNRQISDYIAGRGGNFSPTLINAIKYYVQQGLSNVPKNALNPQAQSVVEQNAAKAQAQGLSYMMPAGSSVTQMPGVLATVPNAYRPVEAAVRRGRLL